jgi:TPR repeat protein
MIALASVALVPAGCANENSAPIVACQRAGGASSPVSSAAYRDKSLADLQSLAAGGDLAAARVVGERYEHGDGVELDVSQAAKWYRSAALLPPQPHIIIVPAVGRNPSYVIPVSTGPSTPGDALALERLAALYRAGHGVPRDVAGAERLASCARERGAPATALSQSSGKAGRHG